VTEEPQGQGSLSPERIDGSGEFRDDVAPDPELVFYREVSRAFPDRVEFFCVSDQSGTLRVRFLGSGAGELFGRSVQELVGLPLLELFALDESEAEELSQHFLRLLQHPGAQLATVARVQPADRPSEILWLRARSTEQADGPIAVAGYVERRTLAGITTFDSLLQTIGAILDAADIAAVAIDAALRILTFNEAGSKLVHSLLGTALEHGAVVTELAPPAIVSELRGRLAQTFTGEVVACEYSLRDADEHLRTFLVTHIPVTSSDGSVAAVILSAFDVSFSRSVQEHNRNLALAIERSPVSVLMTDRDGTIEYVNPYFERQTGYSKAEVIGRKPSILKSGLTPESTYRELWSTILAGREWRGEMLNSRKDGSHYWEAVVISPVLDQEGRAVRFVAVKRDVTKEKRALEELKSDEERYRTLYETAPMGVLQCARNGSIVLSNSSIATILHAPSLLSPEDLDAFSFVPLLRSGLAAALEQAMHNDGPVHGEQEFEPEDGESLETEGGAPVDGLSGERSVVVRFVVTPTHGPDGRVNGAQAFVEDFTERRKAEQRLERSLEEKETLLREIHHRVKNNLQTISSLLRLQAENVGDPRAHYALVDSVSRVYSMSVVHEKLYTAENLQQVRFDEYLGELAQDLIGFGFSGTVEPALELDLAPVALDIDSALPLGLIANELISNALKHAFAQAESPRLGIRLSRSEQTLTMSVADNGPGLTEAVSENAKLGTELIQVLVDQLRASLSRDSAEGLVVTVTLDLGAS
jgi:PAS domain S-box-containing protein